MIKATLFYPLLMIAAMLFLNACTATLPDVRARRDPIESRPRTPLPSPPVVKPRSRPAAITKPYRPIKKPIKTRPERRPTVLVKPDKAESGVNPYDSVPQSGGAPRDSGFGTSSAVKTLLLRAKVDIIAARYEEGASKLERALRIDSRNAEVWHQLARVNYKQEKYSSSITMAQKSNRYTLADSPLEKANWAIIKQASKASGDIKTLKEAIKYERSHP